jgi:hypothetical protein
LYADLVEVKNVLEGVEIGEELKSHDPTVLADQLNKMLTSQEYNTWQNNCKILREKLNWQQEEKVLLKMIENLE